VAATVAQTVEITIASLLTAATIAGRLVPAPLRASDETNHPLDWTLMTRMYGPAVRCKRTFIELSDVRSCINLRKRRDGAFDLPSIAHVDGTQLHAECRRKRLDRAELSETRCETSSWLLPAPP